MDKAAGWVKTDIAAQTLARIYIDNIDKKNR